MSYEVKIKKKVARRLKKLPVNVQKRLMAQFKKAGTIFPPWEMTITIAT